MADVVTSRRNPQVMLLDSLLRQKKAREERGLFVLEGARLCQDAFEAGVIFELVFATEQALGRYPGLLAMSEGAGKTGKLILIGEGLAERVADTGSTQGVFAVCKAFSPPEFLPSWGKRYILLSEIRDPGNLGAILRTAAALGMDGAVISCCAELFSPRVLRASMGGIWRLPVYTFGDIMAPIALLKKAGVPVCAAALRDEAEGVGVLSGPEGAAILVGNEGAGLPRELIESADRIVRIPMEKETESLGAAMAAGILMWETAREDRLS
ncbi:MAG: RNA methyltransferase [Oscillospiraceae bacterium]|jgi:TrmH family RNA methyltransferase|nr:RNA methyltransferase [Oscillospiraceae bacterium]